MIKKIITYVMVTMLFTVQAYAGSQEGLKTAFDELNYSLTVEWDQVDANFKNEQFVKFSNALEALKADGLQDSDITEFIKTQIKDQGLANDLLKASAEISYSEMSAEDAQKFLSGIMKKSYDKGASWDGDGGAAVFLVVLFIFFVAAGVITINNQNNDGGIF